eukprot:5071665-Amphidinium_carterae.1
MQAALRPTKKDRVSRPTSKEGKDQRQNEANVALSIKVAVETASKLRSVSYTHLRAHETEADL